MICRMCGKPKPGHLFWEGEDQYFRVCRDCRTGIAEAMQSVATAAEPLMGALNNQTGNLRLASVTVRPESIAFVIGQLPSPAEARERGAITRGSNASTR